MSRLFPDGSNPVWRSLTPSEERATGAAETRASIVAWLRRLGVDGRIGECGIYGTRSQCRETADAIERGEDLKKRP